MSKTKRFWCEDDSTSLKEIITSKKNGHTLEINGIQYERIGEDMVLCPKSSRILKLVDGNKLLQ